MSNTEMTKTGIIDIHCPTCGAATDFDIVHQIYHCRSCGSKLAVDAGQKQAQGFRKLQNDKLKNMIGNYKLAYATCNGCGATLAFEENEALSTCAFCGKSLVRKTYPQMADFPESIIPFKVTLKEATAFLKDWCEKNRSKSEARKLFRNLDKLQGFYLPYELLRGPVHMQVSRMDDSGRFRCEGFINDEFVNRSKNLDNLLLDGMEPYDLNDLSEFDFGYVGGQRVKIPDIAADVLEQRVRKESAACYQPAVARVLETKALYIDSDVGSALRLPVLLPVYYIADGQIMAAVNGQTGKVSVRAEKPSHYYFLPWWLKAIIATVLVTGVALVAMHLLGMEWAGALYISGMLGLVMLIIMLCMYSDTSRNSFRVESGYRIFTSGEKTFRRINGEMVLDDKILQRKIEEPVFLMMLDGKLERVILRFTSPQRIIRMILLCLLVLFLPIILALLLNGFDFSRINLGGSAVWFCIMVPVVPVYLWKFGIVELYERPWIYIVDENGRKKRYRQKSDFHFGKHELGELLKLMFIPPASLAFWFAVLSFIVIVYLTAGN